MQNNSLLVRTTLRLTLVFGLVWASVLSVLFLLINNYAHKTKQTIVSTASALLGRDWEAAKSYVNVEAGRPVWYFDTRDPDENSIVSRLRQLVIITDSEGRIIERSPAADYLQSAERRQYANTVLQRVQHNGTSISTITKERSGKSFLLLCGQLRGESGAQKYYAFLGRTATEPMINRLLGNWWLLAIVGAVVSVSISALMVRYCISALAASTVS